MYCNHIAKDLPEFLRLKQLLLWCLEEELEKLRNDKGFQRENSNIQNAVVELIKNLYQDIKTQKISTNWVERVPEPVKLKPNPRNVEMQASYETHKKQVQR